MPKNCLLFPVCLVLAGCHTYTALRLEDIGDVPPLTRTQDPTAYPGYMPVSMPMPQSPPQGYNPNSLWRTGARAFFKDQRANRVGDIVTIILNTDDEATLSNNSKASRDSKTDIGIPKILGMEDIFQQAKNGLAPNSIINANSKPSITGTATTSRSEKIKLKLAAIVTQVLPNGNLVVMGRQEIRTNFDVRDALITGVIRPEDITSNNCISWDKIAEARISYGGRGQMTDVNRAPIGQQILNQISPF